MVITLKATLLPLVDRWRQTLQHIHMCRQTDTCDCKCRTHVDGFASGLTMDRLPLNHYHGAVHVEHSAVYVDAVFLGQPTVAEHSLAL